jgi:hypothetical protein
MRTYTIYTQCDHCGVFDRDPQWYALCQRPKEAKRGEKAIGPRMSPRKTGTQAQANYPVHQVERAWVKRDGFTVGSDTRENSS